MTKVELSRSIESILAGGEGGEIWSEAHKGMNAASRTASATWILKTCCTHRERVEVFRAKSAAAARNARPSTMYKASACLYLSVTRLAE